MQSFNLIKRKPLWLKVRLPYGNGYLELRRLIQEYRLHTICHEAICPNIGECFDKGTATFLVLGDRCTRSCLYCNVRSGMPDKPDPTESKRIAKVVSVLRLSYVVITSVTRDDLDDGGAMGFAATIKEIRDILPTCRVEVLVPDFMGEPGSIKMVVDASPSVFSHNIEIVEGLFQDIRPDGDYKRSLKVLKMAKMINPAQKTKSGIMIGFGETKDEVIKVMKELMENRVDIFTIGQYLQPSKRHYHVKKYYTPDEFKEFEEIGYRLGFSFVKAGPLVRSSYMAAESIRYPCL